jgi:hypothetical protein
MNGITRESYLSMSPDAKLNVLFDFAEANYRQGEAIDKKVSAKVYALEKRVAALERRKRFDTAISSGSGLVGGILTVLGALGLKVIK